MFHTAVSLQTKLPPAPPKPASRAVSEAEYAAKMKAAVSKEVAAKKVAGPKVERGATEGMVQMVYKAIAASGQEVSVNALRGITRRSTDSIGRSCAILVKRGKITRIEGAHVFWRLRGADDPELIKRPKRNRKTVKPCTRLPYIQEAIDAEIYAATTENLDPFPTVLKRLPLQFTSGRVAKRLRAMRDGGYLEQVKEDGTNLWARTGKPLPDLIAQEEPARIIDGIEVQEVRSRGASVSLPALPWGGVE